MSSKPSPPLCLAGCSLQVRPGENFIRLIPAGVFDAPRGAMAGSGPWKLTEVGARAIIDSHRGRSTDILVDYEHQYLLAEKNGQPIPASGWVKPASLSWRPDGAEPGLYGQVKWTQKASDLISNDEYRYLSPVFAYDGKTGEVLDLVNVALTNEPAIDEPTIAALSARIHFKTPQSQEINVNETLAKLLATLGLKETASEDDAIAAVAALKGIRSELDNLKADNDTKTQALAALKTRIEDAQNPDPAKFVPIEAVRDLQEKVAALSGRVVGSEVEKMVEAGIAGGKLTESLRAWATQLGQKDVAALKGYIDSAPQIAALKGMQTGGKAPEGADKDGLNDMELAVLGKMQIKREDWLAVREKEA